VQAVQWNRASSTSPRRFGGIFSCCVRFLPRNLALPRIGNSLFEPRRRILKFASTQSKPAIDLEINFDFNSAAIAGKAEPQLDELGAALSDPQLRGATISINGHTDGVGGDAFNKKLSERRAAMIKQYLVDNFHLSAGNLRTLGYGKTRPKNPSDLNAPENRRVEVVNLAAQAQASR
jgi:outer membrane protein OmpA-like peptidoglycan-associated protein